MQIPFPGILPLLLFAFLVALIYSSVGHGGASGYLALLSFFSFSHDQMATSALCLNVLVSGMAFLMFWRSHHFSWRLTWPFVITSLPAAFWGGTLHLSAALYSRLLAFVFVMAAVRLLIDVPSGKEETKPLNLPFFVSFLIGMMIGALSGIVGVGGGIFLSPLLLFLGGVNAKQTAATSAFFIFVNSLAGLGGRLIKHSFALQDSFLLMGLVLAASVGGLLGSRLGARHFSCLGLRRILAGVLFIASFKLLRLQ